MAAGAPGAEGEAPRTPSSVMRKGVWARLAAALLPGDERPQVRFNELEVAHHQTRAGEPYVVVKNRPAATYLRLSEPEYALLQLMDGTRTVGELVVQYFLKYRVLAFQRVAALAAQLRQHHFLSTAAPTNVYRQLGARLRRADLIERLVTGAARWLLGREVMLPGLDRWVTALYRGGGRLLFTRPAQLIMAGVALVGLELFALYLGPNSQRLLRVGDSYVAGFAIFVLAAVLSTAIHELGHALALKHAGREVPRAGFLFYYGLPTFFVDTTDVWMAGLKTRLAVSWAGPYTSLVLGGLASIGSIWFGRVPIVSDVLFTWALVSYLDVLFNLNPLLALDGYYLLMDALERPLLRHDALAFVRGPFWRKLARLQPFTRDERLLAIFGLACAGWAVFSIWLAAYFWERRVERLLVDLWQSPEIGPRLVLVLLLSALVTAGGLGLVVLERSIRPWVFRNSIILARKTRALRQRQVLALLRQVPLLQDLQEARLVEIAERFRPLRLRPSEVVVREGEVGDEFFLVQHGTLEVRRQGELQPAALLGPGSYFGEIELLRQGRRTASVSARTRCDLFVMHGNDFRAAIAHELESFQRIRERVEERAEVAALPLFEGLSSNELDLLLSKLRLEQAEKGAVLVQQGDVGDRFYVLAAGSVDVEIDGQRVEVLGPGDYFGEIALLRDVPRTATVRTREPVRAWSLGAADFRDVLARYLGRAETLEHVVASRLQRLGVPA